MNRIYTKKSQENAKKLRSNQTHCEELLWFNLRAKRLNGIKFRRQVSIGKYIVDFANLGKKLIIELDGSQHSNKEQLLYDKTRTEYLKKNKYTVLRFYDNDVLNNIESVLTVIIDTYNRL
ncbi:endonuclease domain-containing protein [bacterium]|nr:endonuclease domain-containing protein [bacterium]